MQFTTKRIEAGRAIVREQEQRVVLQQRKVQKALADRHPADDVQAQLLIMEQSLLSMVRFLMILERDAEDEISIHKHQAQKRITAQNADPTASEEVAKLADDFASRATASVLRPDDDLNYLDGLARPCGQLIVSAFYFAGYAGKNETLQPLAIAPRLRSVCVSIRTPLR